jgi:peptidyl-prolyl cis-trans isomerase C
MPAVLSLGATVACTGPKDPAILTLGDQAIHRSDFERHLHAIEARDGGAVPPAVREALLASFLEERILVLECRTRGLVKPGAGSEDEEAAVQSLLGAEVLRKVDVAEEEIAAYYTQHAEEFKVPETVALRQILVPTEVEARDVRRRVASDPKSFDTLARSRSHAPEASTGGVMGTFARGQLPPELEVAAFTLPPAGTSDVIATGLGYHVLRVDAHTPARERSLEQSRDEIRSLLLRQKADQSVRQFVQGLMARAKVNHEAAKAENTTS